MKNKIFPAFMAIAVLIFFTQCNNDPKPGTTTVKKKDSVKKKEEKKEEPAAFVIKYHALPLKDSGTKILKRDFTAEQRSIIYAMNRIDAGNVRRADTLIIPDTFAADFMAYSPFPAEAPFLKDVRKIVFFSYPVQAFAAYEYGKLIHWGPSSMGKKATPTPTGLFFANWKSKETHSTVNDEWILKWNFNISNKGGVGWHQYAMPGYPASHSCLRMFEHDARFMYDWAEQWKLKNDALQANGTPTIVFGAYPWGGRRPWKELLNNPKANEITAEMLEKEVTDFLPRILQEQEKRAQVVGVSDTTAVAAAADTAKR